MRPAGVGFRRPLNAAEFFHLSNQAGTLAGAEDLKRRPLLHQFLGVVAEHAFRGGIQVIEAPIETDGDHSGACGLEQVSERFRGCSCNGLGSD